MGLEAAGHVLGSVVGEHGSDLDPVTAVEPEDVVDEAHGVVMGDRSEHDHDDGPAGEDVDGSELVHLAHALQLADVEAVQADELAQTPGGQAEPEEMLVSGCVGQETGGGRGDGGGPGQALRTPSQTVGDQVLLDGRLGDGEPLVAHGLGKRSQRLARAAAITAATTGLLTDAARDEHLFGFCLATGGPGELVCLDSFYIGKLKGVGKVYQLTAIDVFTRWAIVMIVLGPVTHAHTMRFVTTFSGSTVVTGSRSEPCSPTTGPSTWPAASTPTWRPNVCATSGSRPGHPITTPSVNGSTRPP